MNAICLVVDRLHARYVGCYGNTWIATPGVNRLAAESFLFEQAVIDSPSLEALYNSYWLGSHVLERSAGAAERPSLLRLLGQAGYSTTLVTDEPALGTHRLVGDFAELIAVDAPRVEVGTAHDVAQTHLMGFFAVAAQWLSEARTPFCLWLHTQGLAAPWDAPLALRNQYADADEPLPPELVAPPSRRLPDDYDPDELLGMCQAYAGQVSLLDECVAGLLEQLQHGPLARDTLLMLLSARGFPLGEHLRVGVVDDALYGELVQVPWLLRFPDTLAAMARSQALVQPADLPHTLLDWWGLSSPWPVGAARSLMPLVREEAGAVRDWACVAAAGGERGLRTPAWYLRAAPQRPEVQATAQGVELFVKPDDRWERNDVADRCADVAELLQRSLAERETACREGTAADLGPLEDVLVSGLS